MKIVLILALFGRYYWPVSIADMPRTSHTHVQVTGRVAKVKHEADGDLHIWLTDGKNWLVAECIPLIPCRKPKVGQTVIINGISRFDKEHKYQEVNPVEDLKARN